MRGPRELVDRQDAIEAEAAVGKDPRIAGEALRIARDIDREVQARGGDLGGLCPGAGARRVEEHGIEAAG